MGTSTNYKAPTSPQWRNLKREVSHLVRQEILDTTDPADVQDTTDPADVQDTTDPADVQDTTDPADVQDTTDATDINIQKIVKDFVKVNYGSSQDTSGERGRSGGKGGSGGRGGSRGPVQLRAARSVAQNIEQFFSSVANLGFKDTFEGLGLGLLVGKSVREIVYSLLDHLGGPSSTLDQADARKALDDLMGEIFQDVHNSEDVEEAMQRRAHGDSFIDMVRRFFGHYINAQFVRTFYERVNSRMPGTQIFSKIRNFICAAVKYEVSDEDMSEINWSGYQGSQLVDKIFQDTLEVFNL